MAGARTAEAARLYGTIFVATGIPFGFVMAGVFAAFGYLRAAAPGALTGVGAGLATGILFGLAMSAVLGTLALRVTRGLKPGALAVRQERTVDVAGSRAEATERARAALAAIPGARPPTLDDAAGSLETRVGPDWRSWGEVVTARLTQSSPGLFRVCVRSRPRWWTTVVDYGKGFRNVEAVVAALKPHEREVHASAPAGSKPRFLVDGSEFSTMEEFYDVVSRVLLPGRTWGRNLDAFNDILRGGFGTPDGGFVLVWKDADVSRERLGTHFDTLVQILRGHGAGGEEAEDGVELILE